MTDIQVPAPGEDTHAEIFSQLYGGTFSVTDSVSFTNGAITAQRVDDENDLLFSGEMFDAESQAVFATRSQTFGYMPGASGGTFQQLIAVTGNQYNVSGAVANMQVNAPIRLARMDNDYLVTSQPSDNSDGLDHMITYSIQGLNTTQQVMVIFFEDLPQQDSFADFDYNDLVVELRLAEIPEPGTISMLAGLVLMVMPRRLR
ncbi:MAG: DUF4114 domain-containing protein [Phycisphaeraceae bacterium]|nr:DUF4114 domain-containing protein [Phycisphaeraceae bacterium]